MDQQKFEQHCVIKFCVKLHESATVTHEKLQWLMDNITYPWYKCLQHDQKWKMNLMLEDLQPQTRMTMWKE